MGIRYIFAALLALFGGYAQADNCATMAEMANDVANLRDAGVPLASVEKRLRRDVTEPQELTLGLIVARLVYKTNGTGQQLRTEVLKKCK